MAKGEIALDEQFLILSQYFKLSACGLRFKFCHILTHLQQMTYGNTEVKAEIAHHEQFHLFTPMF